LSDPTFSPERALEAIGERWSLLVMREAMFRGTTRFDEFHYRIAIAPDILGARLDAFVSAGLMERADNDDDAGGSYILTDRGRNLEPVVTALSTWQDGWDVPGDQRVAVPAIAAVESSAASTADSSFPAEAVWIEICLLGTFMLKVGGVEVGPLTAGSQRLLAFLALHERAITRVAMAGTMWPDVTEERAGISLRSALSRLDRATHEAILSASTGLSLADAVGVDFQDARALARRLLTPGEFDRGGDLGPAATEALSAELLPDWYDDWVVTENEDWRGLRMSALEAQSGYLLGAGRMAAAALAARAAVNVEPLRESATACLIRAHLAKGNQSEVLRVYERYSKLLWDSLGLQPTDKLTELVAGIVH
jgi:DNA-binding SARP family transcriptional activator/DNA-binding HxlR family transcriptional regulator